MAAGPVAQPARQADGSAPPKRAIARQGRADQLRRARAAAQVVRVAFPKVEQLRIELSFEDRSSTSPTAQAHMLYPPARAFFTYPCPHSDCDGEFDLESAVRKAVGDGPHEVQGSLACGGARIGEQGSKRPCELRLTFSITARPHGGI